MKRLLWTSLMVLLIFAICTFAAKAATLDPPTEDLLTTDVLGYTCVAEEDLDAAFLNQGKGGAVPQTCIFDAPSKDCDSLIPLLGRAPNASECATHAYRYLSWFDPDKSTGWGFDCGDCTVDPPKVNPPAVPIPGAALMLASALGFLTLVRRLG